jgi:hypothetical protein
MKILIKFRAASGRAPSSFRDDAPTSKNTKRSQIMQEIIGVLLFALAGKAKLSAISAANEAEMEAGGIRRRPHPLADTHGVSAHDLYQFARGDSVARAGEGEKQSHFRDAI